MLQIDHRESYDIDIFLDDPQLLPFSDPLAQDLALRVMASACDGDGATFLRIVYEDLGEIDFICRAQLTAEPVTTIATGNRNLKLETPAEIITKKIVYRGASLQPRDIFDLAAVLRVGLADDAQIVAEAFLARLER